MHTLMIIRARCTYLLIQAFSSARLKLLLFFVSRCKDSPLAETFSNEFHRSTDLEIKLMHLALYIVSNEHSLPFTRITT